MTCQHVAGLRPVAPRTPEGCEECLKAGTQWVHLRFCLGCGHVGCCDSSPGHHASRHAKTVGHAIAASYEPGESWAWCFVDDVEVEVPAGFVRYLRR